MNKAEEEVNKELLNDTDIETKWKEKNKALIEKAKGISQPCKETKGRKKK